MKPQDSDPMQAEASGHWEELHASPRLAQHAAIYTWLAGRISSGWVLDLGCEYGFGSLLIAESNPQLLVTGMDVDVPSLRYAKKTQSAGRLHWVSADAHVLPLASECLSGIYLINLLNMVGEPVRVLSEVWRTLKPGGVAIVGLPAAGGPENRTPKPEHLEQLVLTMESLFAEVIQPASICGSIPSFPPQSFVLDQPTSPWVAFCRKGQIAGEMNSQ
jgi:SAM-dependent methyltransferase